MRRTLTILVITAAASLTLVACKDDKHAPPAAAEPADHAEKEGHADKPGHADEHQHAHAGAKPGSHEDWCGEHAVPESLCTRCNATLIPAFKASGDWCEPHGLPESQCLKCNPGLKIERPPRVEGTSQ